MAKFESVYGSDHGERSPLKHLSAAIANLAQAIAPRGGLRGNFFAGPKSAATASNLDFAPD